MQKHTVLIVSGAAAAIILIGGVASAQSAAFSSEIGVGAQGTEVTSLQTWLENNGYYSGPVTGYFGSLTQAGVEDFQTANSISATGYVGPLTLAALNAKASGTTTTGANAPLIAQLEAQLNSLLAQIQAIESNTTTTSTGVPVGSSMTVSSNEGASVNGNLNGSGTSPLTYAISSYPLNGTLTAFTPSTGSFTYTPNANYSGSDSFSYTVANSAGVSAPMTVTINIVPTTTTSMIAPTGQMLSFSTANGAAINGTLAGSGTGPFTYQIVTNPVWGSLTSFSPTTGSFTYIPNSGYNGSDSFVYAVGNGMATSTNYTVSLTD